MLIRAPLKICNCVVLCQTREYVLRPNKTFDLVGNQQKRSLRVRLKLQKQQEYIYIYVFACVEQHVKTLIIH